MSGSPELTIRSAAATDELGVLIDGPEAMARFDVLGVQVSAVSMAQAVAAITRWIAAHRLGEATTTRYVCVSDVHAVLECRSDRTLQAVHNAAAMVTPDGMPLVWLGRWLGHRHMTRVYGPDLMLELCGAPKAHGLRHFFYGGAKGVAPRLARRLSERFPDLIVAGTLTPPFRSLSADERAAVIGTIESCHPDIVWVGLGAPKQERWMAEIAPKLRMPVLIGVGAAFDFLAGTKPQAPRWMQRGGLEWLFRLATEPRRLWRRYLASLGVFPWLVAWELMLGRTRPN